ncbi:tetratricopeptide repeat protein [Nitrospirillum sp. BR 11828]|uniref:tetratricopeptide repeat protein n=1 Tax=Nitrospirillum sp. BR 11828 TaxID=3104325 RepID=UPI002ACA2540|nr:tetratricopeptide repeat protein [Nitrospirillum sp. BR 11828]MDZ5650028.1 tetratricopeptide repeat protein [Nitrospirillum sp. BR 11828]
MADTVETAVLTIPEALSQATALHDAGKYAEAEVILAAAIAHHGHHGDLLNARGVMFAQMGRHLDALWCYRDALAANPRGSGIWTNLGNALTKLKYLKSAVDAHQRAIELAPNDVLLHHNLGTSLAEAGDHGAAVLAFSRALDLNPDFHKARWDRGRSYLYFGNYRPAWADYEVRLISGQVPIRENLKSTKWDGSPYGGKRLLLLAEQGFGDTLWVARYLSRVKALGGELIVECQKEIIPLLADLGVADQFIPWGAPLPEADYHAHLCSLPGLFTMDFGSIPAKPYLKAPADRITKFASIFGPPDGRLRVGIVWSGSTTFKRNGERARPLLGFFQAFAQPGVQLYSLQKGPPEKSLHDLPRGGPIIDLAPHLGDFADTAAAIHHLDLVIMTDSSVAHLTGAMGKEVWVLLGHVAHWLWLLDRTDCPWYPSMRLFRPRAEGDWEHVFDGASAELTLRTGIMRM